MYRDSFFFKHYYTTFESIWKFTRRDSKPKKRLQENRAVIQIKDEDAHGIALFSRSLFLDLESLLEKLWMMCTA